MQGSTRQIKLHSFYRYILFYWLSFIILFLLFSSFNIGGEGVDLPFNIMIWGVVCLFILSTLIKGVKDKQIKWSKLLFVLLALLCGLLIVGSIQANWGRDALMQTVFNFIVISLFLWALFQYKLTQVQFIQLLMLFCLLGALQAFIGVVQLHDSYRVLYTLTSYEAFRLTGERPLGTFQQVNMLATFLAFTLVASLYVLSTRVFLRSSRVLKIGLLLSVLLMAYVLFLTGSRAGMLAWLVGTGLMLIARHQSWGQSKREGKPLRPFSLFYSDPLFPPRFWLLLWFLMLAIAFFLSNTFPGNALGLGQVVQKTVGVAEGIRWLLYQQSLVLFMQSPLTGLGIGNFIESFSAHIKENDLTVLQEAYWTHPHNELLYWMLQSGVIALVLSLVFMGYFLYLLFQNRRAFSLAILALMMPFAIQAQLSYPFSLSSLHLFIPLVLMYVGTRRYATAYRFSIPTWAQISATTVLLGLVVVVLFSAWHSLKSIKELYIFENSLFYTQFQSKEEIANQRYLQHATHNVLYREKSILAMNTMVKKAIESNNQYDLQQFVWWAEERGGEISQSSLLSLVKVYLAQGNIEEAKQAVQSMSDQFSVALNLNYLQQKITALQHTQKGASNEPPN